MSAKAVREVQSLGVLRRHLDPELAGGVQLLNFASIDSLEDLDTVPDAHPWVLETVKTLLHANRELLFCIAFEVQMQECSPGKQISHSDCLMLDRSS